MHLSTDELITLLILYLNVILCKSNRTLAKHWGVNISLLRSRIQFCRADGSGFIVNSFQLNVLPREHFWFSRVMNSAFTVLNFSTKYPDDKTMCRHFKRSRRFFEFITIQIVKHFIRFFFLLRIPEHYSQYRAIAFVELFSEYRDYMSLRLCVLQ